MFILSYVFTFVFTWNVNNNRQLVYLRLTLWYCNIYLSKWSTPIKMSLL